MLDKIKTFYRGVWKTEKGPSLRKRTINLILSVICLAFILLTLIPLFLGYFVGPKIAGRILEQRVENLFQKSVEVERAGITIFGGFGIEYKNVRIQGTDGKEFFRADAFLLKPWIKSLLLGRLRWKRVVLRNPSIHLIRTSEGHIGFDGKRTEKADKGEREFLHRLTDMVTHLPSHLSIRGGRIRFADLGISQTPIVTEIEELDLTSQAISSKKPLSFVLTGRFVGGMEEKLSISGKVTQMDKSMDPREREFMISLGANNIDCRWIWPYVRSAIPFGRVRGLLDLKATCTGGLTGFRSSGEMRIRHGHFAIPTLYTSAIELREASLHYDLEYEKEGIHISRLVIRIPHVSASGSARVLGIASGNPSISLKFTTEKASLEHIRPYLPDRLIPANLHALLTDSRIEGFLQVEKARLEGPWASLNPEGLRKNPEMLSCQTRLDNCTLVVGSELPPFRNISGVLTLQGDQAGIKGFRGQFLRSRLLELDGSISKIYSDPRMVVSFKGDLDLKGLLSLLKAKQMPTDVRKALDPIRKISGRATIAGEIRHAFNRLTDLTYKGRISLRRVRVGIAGLALPLTNVEGEIRCDEKEILLSGFKWRMGKSLCRGSASFRQYLGRHKRKLARSKKMRISFDMGVTEISIDDLLSSGRWKGKIKINPKSVWVNSTILGKVRISRGHVKGFGFQDLETSFTMKRGLLRFEFFRAQAPGGFIRCRGWINLKSKQTVSFKLIPEIHHLDMTNVMRIFPPQQKGGFASGVLNLEGVIVGGGNCADRVIRSLGGNLRLRAERGVIEGLSTRRKGGLPYKKATAQIVIERGVFSTEDLYLDSDVMSMTIKGQANLNNASLDLLVGVRPLQTVDKILSNIPVAGWLLAGKDRSILTFCYRVRGQFNDLRVESKPAQNGRSMSH